MGKTCGAIRGNMGLRVSYMKGDIALRISCMMKTEEEQTIGFVPLLFFLFVYETELWFNIPTCLLPC